MGMGELPMNGVGIALLLLSMVAFSVDVQVGVPRLWTGVGLVLFTIASLIMFRNVDGLTMRPSWITLSVGIIGIALTFIVGMPSMVRTRFGTPTIGRSNLVGATGVAVGAVDPEGIVMVDGAKWRARTNRATPLADLADVRVASIDGITLEVEPLEGAAQDYREARNKPQ
jgi:membrane-bound serine protease (ClpP class)